MGFRCFKKFFISTGFIALSAFYCDFSFGQTFEDYKNAKTITEKCEFADQLTMRYLSNHLDSLKILGYDLLVEANKIKNERGVQYARYLIGDYLIRTANELKGLELLRHAKTYFIQNEEYNRVTEVCNEMGNAYQYMQKYEDAIKWYNESIKYGEMSTDESLHYTAELNLAQALSALGKYTEARKRAEHYRDWVLELGAMADVSNSYAVLGKMALAQEKNKEAVYFFEQCYKFATKDGERVQQAHANTNIGIALFLQGKANESVDYFQKALELHLKVNNISLICDAYLNLGGIYFELSDFERAKENYLLGLEVARENEKYSNEIELLTALLEVEQDEIEKKQLLTDLDHAKVNKGKKENLQNEFDKLLEKELKESERIQASGFVASSNKVPFYIGGIVIFVLFAILALRKS